MATTNTARSQQAAKTRAAAERAAAITREQIAAEQAAQSAADGGKPETVAAPPAPPSAHADRIEYPDDYGVKVLDETRSFLTRFCVFPNPEAADIVTLWVAHTWAIGAFITTPRLAFVSPEPGSGKTRAQTLCHLLSRNARLELDLTGPTLATIMGTEEPTLFFDEVDTVFGKGGSNTAHIQLRGILNSGYKRGAMLTRKSGKNSVESIPVFGPVCFAGLGMLPDTLRSRSLNIKMRKRKATETIDRYFPRMHDAIGKALGQSLGEWVKTKLIELSGAWPEIPDGIEDREAECAEPILAIADAAGGHWPATARRAIRHLYLEQSNELGESPAEKLLRDIRNVWPHEMTRVGSAQLVFGLFGLTDSNWSQIWDATSAAREMATLLATRGINVRKVKTKDATGNPVALQGYRKEDFALAWQALDQKDAAAEEQRRAEEQRLAQGPEEPDSDVADDDSTDSDNEQG